MQRRVLAVDRAVLEDRDSGTYRKTPLIHAIASKKPATALWIIEHRGEHDLETVDDFRRAAMH